MYVVDAFKGEPLRLFLQLFSQFKIWPDGELMLKPQCETNFMRHPSFVKNNDNNYLT